MSAHLGVVERAVRLATARGADEAEAFLSSSMSRRVSGEAGRLSLVETKKTVRLVVRAAIGKKVGAATTELLDERAVEDVVRRALSSARAAPEDPRWPGLPATKPSSRDAHFDKSMLSLEVGDLVRLAGDVLKLVSEQEPRAEVPDIVAEVAASTVALANSNGTSGEYRTAVAWLGFTLVARTDGRVTPTIFEMELRKDVNFDALAIVSSGIEALRDAIKSVAAETCERPAVLTPYALHDLLSNTLFPAVEGDNVARKKSPLTGKLGEPVVSPLITLLDDPLTPTHAGERPFDDEGVPSRKTTVIERGTFVSALWNTYWGSVAGFESTANGSRNLSTGEVMVLPTTLVLSPGSGTALDLVAEFGECYFIRGFQGAHTANPDTGDFSVVATPAYLVKGGEVVGSVEGLMMSGNVFELLFAVEKVGSDVKNLGSLVAPSVAFSVAKFAAKG